MILDVSYSDRGTTFDGVLHPPLRRTDGPGILLVHGGGGLDVHAREQADRWAAAGYAVLACDMFGRGVAGDRERVVATLMRLRDDPDELVRRAAAGIEVLRSRTNGHIAAVGYCFGGMAALTMARAGLPLAAAVSIHGSLATARPAWRGDVVAKVLVCHGSADPHVPLDDVVRFAREMDAAGADWRLTMYGGALHGFTHRHAVRGAVPGVEYDEHADRESFRDASVFLAAALSIEHMFD